MTPQWQYQVRFDVSDPATAESIRRKSREPVLAFLFEILARHHAVPKCQFDAFAEYVAAAERHGVESYPLYHWTKETIENPAKKEKYLKSFTVYVDDREVYAREIADALETDLQPLVSSGLIARISKYDTNPPKILSHRNDRTGRASPSTGLTWRPLINRMRLSALFRDAQPLKEHREEPPVTLKAAIINNCPNPHVGVCRSNRTWRIGVTNFSESSRRSCVTDLPSLRWPSRLPSGLHFEHTSSVTWSCRSLRL